VAEIGNPARRALIVWEWWMGNIWMDRTTYRWWRWRRRARRCDSRRRERSRTKDSIRQWPAMDQILTANGKNDSSSWVTMKRLISKELTQQGHPSIQSVLLHDLEHY